MKILIVEPHQHPRRAEIPHTLNAMHEVVGGYIEITYPFGKDRVALVCDEEGLYKGTEWNRLVAPGVGIKGTFFLAGLGEEDLDDLPDDLADKYEKKLWEAHTFVRTPHGVKVITEGGQLLSID